MSTALLFVNRAPGGERLKLILIKPGDYTFGKRECMESWVAAGNQPETWSYSFTKIVITDREPEELQYLLDTDAEGNRVWQFIEPAVGSGDYADLVAYGGMTRSYDEVEQYLIQPEQVNG